MDVLSWDSPPPEEFSAAFAGKQGAGKQGKQGKRGLDSPLPVVQWAKKEFSVRPGAGKQGAGKPGKQGKRGRASVITHTWCRKLVAKWCDSFPIHADRPQLGTWLDWSVSQAGAGCAVCAASGRVGRWAEHRIHRRSAFRCSHVLRHSRTKSHQIAVRKFLGPPLEETESAPPREPLQHGLG